MLKRDEWLDLARKLDWEYCYVRADEVFPQPVSGRPWLPPAAWAHWEEPFRSSFAEYVVNQHAKDAAVLAVREALGKLEDVERLETPWINALKLFDQFERAVSSRHYVGFGLGLWITSQIVEAHGGRIGVENAAGAGATLTVDLPRRKASDV